MYKNSKTIKSILLCNYDVICLTETWLRDDIKLSELNINGYSVYRCDSSHFTGNCARAGGVMILVQNKYISSQLDTATTNVKHIFVSLSVNGMKHFIGSVYIPPGSEIHSDHCATIKDILQMNRVTTYRL